MPAAIPVLVSIAASTIGPVTIAGVALSGAAVAGALTFAASVAVAGYQADRARSRARRQRAEALAGQTVLLRSATVPRRVVYGRAMVSGPIVFAESTGTSNNTLHLVIPLCEGEIDAVEEIYLNEKPVGWASFDANGNPTTGPFVRTRRDEGSVIATPAGSGLWSATVPSGAVIVSVTSNTIGYVNDGTMEGPSGASWVRTNATTVSGSGADPTKLIQVGYYVDTPLLAEPKLKIRAFTGSSTQAASSELIAAVPAKWTSDHRLRGIAYLYVVLVRDETIYPTGLPNIKARIRGKRVLDPRDGVTRWSDNWALCVRDYLITYCGAAAADIDSAKVIAAANKSDEAVLSAGRPAAADYGVTALTRNTDTEPRYTLNGAIGLDESPQDVLDRMMAQGVGLLTWTEGKWQIRAGAYESPDPLCYFDESDLIGPLAIQPRRKRSDLYNAARARYVACEQGYIEYDATPYRSTVYKAQDNGEELFADFGFGLCRTNSEAQRLMRATLELSRRQMTVDATVGIARGLIPQAGDTIALTSARHGLVDKVFRVLRWEWASPQAVRLTLREEDNGWDGWSSIDAAETPPPRASSLPDPFTKPVLEGLDVASGPAYARRRPDGVIVQGARVSWTASTNPSVLRGGRIEVQYRVASDTSWTSAESVQGDATSVLIDQLTPDIVYVFRARAITAIGVPGDYAYHSETILGPASTFQTTGYLTNESVTVAADSTGAVASFAPAAGTYKVFASLTDITELSTFSVVSSSGVTIAISNTAGTRGQYTVSAMSADTGTATLRATFGSSTLDKVFSISKSRAGVSSFAYWIAGSSAFARSQANVYSPSALTLTAYRSGPGGVPETYAGRWKVDTSTDGATFTNNAATGSDSATVTYTPSGGTLKTVRVRLLVAGGGGQVLDEVLLPVVVDGPTGATGTAAITPLLTNAAHTVPADTAGAVSSYAGSGTLIQVYEGTTALTYVASLTAPSQFTIGSPVVAPSGQITVGARSGTGTTTATVAAHSAMGAATDTLTITYPVTVRRANGTDSTLDLVQTITKSKGGANAQLLWLSATAQAFTFDGADNAAPASQTITFTANLQNLSGTATFACTLYNQANVNIGTVTLGGSGNTRTLTVAQFGDTAWYAIVTATLGGFSDQMTVVALEDGQDGLGGKNLLSNTNFKAGVAGWEFYGIGTGAAANVSGGWANSTSLFPLYVLSGAGVLYLRELGVRASNNVTGAVLTPTVTRSAQVVPGERFEVSVYAHSHRCSMDLLVQWLTASDTQLSLEAVAAGIRPTEVNDLQPLSAWTRIGGFVTAPAGAVKARPILAKSGTLSGTTDSYMWSTMWYFGRANPTQTQLGPWSDGTLRDVDTTDLAADAATTVYMSETAGASINAPTSAVIGIGQITVPSFPYATRVLATASTTGYLEYHSPTGGTQSLTIGINQNKIGVMSQVIASVNSAKTSELNSTATQAEFELPANSAAFNVSCTLARDNGTSPNFGAASYSTVRLRVEVVKR